MEFPIVHVRSCKVNLAGDISLSFRLAINDENMARAAELALLIGQENDAGILTFIPSQPPLFLKGVKPEFKVDGQAVEQP